jgi:hypothetical protein
MSPKTPDEENLGLRDFYNETGGDDIGSITRGGSVIKYCTASGTV